jgi:hypothetical protein
MKVSFKTAITKKQPSFEVHCKVLPLATAAASAAARAASVAACINWATSNAPPSPAMLQTKLRQRNPNDST